LIAAEIIKDGGNDYDP
jgi:hypothetical protein